MNKNLKDEIQHIIDQGLELKHKYIAKDHLRLDFINIFSQTDEEYQGFVAQIDQLGKPVKDIWKGVIVSLDKQFDVENDKLSYIMISKPREDRKVQGYLSYYLNNFEEMHTEFEKSGNNTILVRKPDYMRLEVADDEHDVKVYMTSSSMLETVVYSMNEKNTEGNPDLQNDINKLQADLEKEKELRLHLMADFQNFKKRNEQDKATWGAISNMGLIQDILEVYDDMQLALQDDNLNIEHAKTSLKSAQDKLVQAAERAGIAKIDVKVGEVFDKEKMEAVSVVPVQDENQKGKVIAVITTAYKYQNRDGILKAAKVVVGK